MKKRWIIILAAVCIGFILIHSMIPESKSAQESLWFTTHVINPLLSRFGIVADKDVVRKIAHAVEFGILSIAVFAFWKSRNKRIGQIVLKTVYTGFTLAFLDESLQVVTGRGALITDIWIDLIGVGIGTIIAYFIARNKWFKKEVGRK